MLHQLRLKPDRSEVIDYELPDFPIYLRRGLLSSYPDYRAPAHWHDDIELILIFSGEMFYKVNEDHLLLKSGQGIFVNSRQIHYGFSDAKTECDFLCLLIHPMILSATPAYENRFLIPVMENSALPYLLLDPSVPWKNRLLQLTQGLYDCARMTDARAKTMPLRVQAAFAEFWALLYEHMPADAQKKETGDNDLSTVKNMVRFIERHYTEKLSLQELSRAGAVGQSKCCKLFNRFFGQSPNLYLTHYRLGKSLELLKQTDLSVTEIALSVGFHSASYYAETFRKWYGMKPTEFRASSR